MKFNDYLATFPCVQSLARLDILDQHGTIIHSIPAIEGKLGSLKLYNALAQRFHHQLNTHSAEQGLIWFAEHVADAKLHPGKHPNIDLLFKVIATSLNLKLRPITKV